MLPSSGQMAQEINNLAKVALGIISPDEGYFTADLRNLQVGYVPQKLEINWTVPLTVLRFLTLTNKASKSDIEEALIATDTAHLADAQISSLSGGGVSADFISKGYNSLT